MDDTRSPQQPGYADTSPLTPQRPRRGRSTIVGAAIRIVVAAAILIGAGLYVMSLVATRPEPPQRQQRERSFTVAVVEPSTGTFSPSIRAFGQITASRTIDMRAEVGGEAVEVSPNLVAGGEVDAGELLVKIDSFAYDGALRDAEAALSDARLQLTVAEEQLSIEEINADAAEAQLDLARRDLERARSLLNTGSATSKDIEDRELIVSQREQTLAQRQSSIKVQQAAIERQQTAIARAEWARDQAERALANTEIRAPFDAVVISETAEPGRLISSNETIAQLYERNTLEVRFVISDQQYGQLLNDGLIGRPVTAVWDIAPRPLAVTGRIVRAGAEIDAALGGVMVFAELSGSGVSELRPGTFVEISIEGLAYENALLLPETALYENNHFYVIRDGRMARIDAELLARDGGDVIVRADVPEGERIITTRVAQAGDGLLVSVEGEEPVRQFGGREGGENGARSGGQRPQGGQRGGGPDSGGDGGGG